MKCDGDLGWSDSDEESDSVDDLDEELEISEGFFEHDDRKSGLGQCQLDDILLYKTTSKILVSDVKGLEFDSVEEAERFYRKYAMLIGFGVRKDLMFCTTEGIVLKRRWVCCRVGVRPAKYIQKEERTRKHRPVTRVKCRAAFRVCLCQRNVKYIVTGFSVGHNHDFVESFQCHLLLSNRNVPESMLATAVSLRKVGVKTSRVMDLFVEQRGGFKNVGFTQKDLQNRLNDYFSKEIDTTDAEAALLYFRAKGQMDNGLFVTYSLDERNRMRNLFWADSISRYDYACFGDVVGFDASYSKNKYKKPVVMMIGTNNHWRTTVYAVALLSNENLDSYCWLLQTFLDAMKGKEPVTVITDGNKAMIGAVKNVFPNSHHRLCSWHLERNAQTAVGNSEFTARFGRLMYADIEVEEFECRWHSMVETYQVSRNPWVKKVYKMKLMWATCYLKGTFFAGMRSNQRYESINAFLNRFLNCQLKLYQFVEKMDVAIGRIRNNEVQDDYRSRHIDPVIMSVLKVYEKHASRLYTREVFDIVRDEIFDEQEMVVTKLESRGGIHLFCIKVFLNVNKKWDIMYRESDKYFQCSCKLFESEGIPCSHVIAVLKFNHVRCLPDSLIRHRWTKDAKNHLEQQPQFIDSVDARVRKVAMMGSLSMSSNRLCYLASRDIEEYHRVLTSLEGMVQGLEAKSLNHASTSCVEKDTNMKSIINDLEVVNTKGAPKQHKRQEKRTVRCSHCKCFGHNVAGCKKRKSSVEVRRSSGRPMNEPVQPFPGR